MRGTVIARVLKCASHRLPMPQSKELATLARHSGYRVKSMARELGCSCCWLEIHCQRRFALTPHAWLVRLRAEEIQMQACTGAPAKVLCELVGVTYFLERSADLRSSFTRLATDLIGQAGLSTYTDTNAIGAGPFFCRVGAGN